MQPRLAQAAALILPDEPLDAICYGCTSASMVLGDDKVISNVHEGKPGVPVTNPALAARLGLRALGARRISVLTPYLPETSAESPVISVITASRSSISTASASRTTERWRASSHP